jgi:hypothetical protein
LIISIPLCVLFFIVTVYIGCFALSNYIQDSKVNEKIKLKNKDLGHKEGVCHNLFTCRGGGGRLSWLTNSALVYEPKYGGRGGLRVQRMSTAIHMEPK